MNRTDDFSGNFIFEIRTLLRCAFIFLPSGKKQTSQEFWRFRFNYGGFVRTPMMVMLTHTFVW